MEFAVADDLTEGSKIGFILYVEHESGAPEEGKSRSYRLSHSNGFHRLIDTDVGRKKRSLNRIV
jgi:hypothetical protein